MVRKLSRGSPFSRRPCLICTESAAFMLQLYSNGKLSVNFASLRDAEPAPDYAQRLADELRQIDGFPIPADFMQKQVHVPYGHWAPHVDAVITTLQRVLVPLKVSSDVPPADSTDDGPELLSS